jgi:hypothetical protein
MAVQVTRWQFTADDYERMVETGILGEADAWPDARGALDSQSRSAN